MPEHSPPTALAHPGDCIGYLLWSGAVGKPNRRAPVAAAVAGGECLVFAADGLRWPLTTPAEAASAGSGSFTVYPTVSG